MKTKTHIARLAAGLKTWTTAFAVTGLLVTNAHAQSFPASCNVSQIDISTGVNHLAGGTLYPYSGAATIVDPYWKVTMVPTNTVGITAPFCAYLTDSSLVTGSGVWGSSATPGSRWISLATKPTTADLGAGSGFFWKYNYSSPYGPINNANPIRFTRKFYVNGSTTQNITVNLSAGFGDDIVFAAFDATAPIFNTPGNPNNIYYNASYSTTFGIPATTVTVALSPGMHTLDIDLYDISGNITGINVMGTLSCPNPALIDNICYGVDSSCAGITPGGCDDLCYWRVVGNNINGSNNIFGTLSQDNVRIKTSAADRGIITADGRLGWSTMTPSTLLHVFCGHKYNAPSDIRFEKLPTGAGRVLVIDDQGYVYASAKLQAREANTAELSDEVAQLKEELAALKQQLGITTAGQPSATDVLLYPNPARNNLDVRFTSDNVPAGEIVIMDVQGRRLQSVSVARNSKDLSVNISALPSGVYVANLVVNDKTVTSKKFVVEK